MDNIRHAPDITVYIPCHNYGAYLNEAIESVFRQSYKNWELIIIDDGSTDKTPEIVQLYTNAPNIRTFRTEKIGLPGVCNLALREAAGKYIIRLDGDDVFDENILLVLKTYLDNHPDIIMAFPDYYLMDQMGNIFAHERRRKLYEEDHILDMPPNGACILAKTQVLRDLGGYREDLGAQDGFDLWTRVRERYKCGNVNLPLFYYRRHYKNLTGAEGESQIIKTARRQIKKDISAKKLKASRPVIGVIPIRKFFDFAEDLWSLKLGDRTLLEHSLARFIDSDMFDHVIVTSDNEDAREIIEKQGDKRLKFHLRSFESTYRTSPLAPLLEEVITPYDPDYKGVTVVSYVQAPFLTKGSMEESVYSLLMADADAAISVEKYAAENLYVQSAYGLQQLQLGRYQYLEGGTVFGDVNVCTAVKSSNVKRGSIRGPRLTSFNITGPEGFFISSDYSYDIAQLIARKF